MNSIFYLLGFKNNFVQICLFLKYRLISEQKGYAKDTIQKHNEMCVNCAADSKIGNEGKPIYRGIYFKIYVLDDTLMI